MRSARSPPLPAATPYMGRLAPFTGDSMLVRADRGAGSRQTGGAVPLAESQIPSGLLSAAGCVASGQVSLTGAAWVMRPAATD